GHDDGEIQTEEPWSPREEPHVSLLASVGADGTPSAVTTQPDQSRVDAHRVGALRSSRSCEKRKARRDVAREFGPHNERSLADENRLEERELNANRRRPVSTHPLRRPHHRRAAGDRSVAGGSRATANRLEARLRGRQRWYHATRRLLRDGVR